MKLQILWIFLLRVSALLCLCAKKKKIRQKLKNTNQFDLKLNSILQFEEMFINLKAII